MQFTRGQSLLNGKYEIERLLGEVYLARHVRLNAPRALKVLRRTRRAWEARSTAMPTGASSRRPAWGRASCTPT